MSTPAMRAIGLPYPCRCLCLGFVQMHITTPWRRTILQLSQRVLMDALTFNGSSSCLATVRQDGCLLQSVRDPAARQGVGRELHAHAVAGQDPDEVHPELSGNMRQH